MEFLKFVLESEVVGFGSARSLVFDGLFGREVEGN